MKRGFTVERGPVAAAQMSGPPPCLDREDAGGRRIHALMNPLPSIGVQLRANHVHVPAHEPDELSVGQHALLRIRRGNGLFVKFD